MQLHFTLRVPYAYVIPEGNVRSHLVKKSSETVVQFRPEATDYIKSIKQPYDEF